MVEIAIGFVVGTVLALIAGYGLARSDLFARLASPYLVAAQAVPILVLAPLLVVWFGSGLLSKAVICSLIVFFPVAIATMVGIRSVDPRLLELGRSLRATKRQILTTLEIPAALPNIFGGLRVGVTLAVVGAVVGEWAGANTRPGRPDQPRPGVALRHPVDVRHAPDHRPGRDRPLPRRRRRRAQARRRAVNQPAQTEVHVSSALPRRPMRFAAVAAFAVVVALVAGCATGGTDRGDAPSRPRTRRPPPSHPVKARRRASPRPSSSSGSDTSRASSSRSSTSPSRTATTPMPASMSSSRTRSTPSSSRWSAREPSTSGSATGPASSPPSAGPSRSPTSPRSTASSPTSSSPRTRPGSRRRPT